MKLAKIKNKHKSLYRFYYKRGLSCGNDFGCSLEALESGQADVMRSYHTYESNGSYVPCVSPQRFKRIASGKAVTKLTIDMWMEDLKNGIIYRFEVEDWIQGWPESERKDVLTRMDKIYAS